MDEQSKPNAFDQFEKKLAELIYEEFARGHAAVNCFEMFPTDSSNYERYEEISARAINVLERSAKECAREQIEIAKALLVVDVPLEHVRDVRDVRWDRGMNLGEMIMFMKEVNNADINSPIFLSETGELLDGRERLMKAMLQDQKTIKAVRFEKSPLPCNETS